MLKIKKGPKAKAETQNWYKDRYQYAVMHRKILVIISLASMACTVFTLLIISQLAASKSIEPFVIQIDQKSGMTQVLDPVRLKELTINEAVNNYFIIKYIRSREGYHANDIGRNYDVVRLMSEPTKVFGQYRKQISPNNPDSVVTRLGSFGERTVNVKSVTYLGPQQVQIRYSTRTTGQGRKASVENSIALLEYEYVKMPLSMTERYINPLGFRITDYRTYEDIASP